MTKTAAPVLRLRLQAAAALLLTAALLVAALVSFATARADLHRLAAVSEPRATAAADLYRTLADLDAQHADSLVVGYASTPAAPGQSPTLVDDGVLAALTAQADRRQVGHDLAALAAAGGQGQADVQALLDSLGTYDGLSGTEEYSATSQQDPVVGRPPDLALDFYDQAEGLLQQSLLPHVRTLLTSADQQVGADRGAAVGNARRGALLLGAVGVLALLLLVWWQLDLSRRHRRMLNPALLLATAAVLSVVVAGGSALLGAASAMDGAVRQGYAPGATVAQAQVAAADAEASQSRWLVDTAYRPSLASGFGTLAQQLHTLTAGDAGSPGVTRTEAAYLASDRTLRSLADAGRLDQAAVQLTGVTRGQVAFAYYDFSLNLQNLADLRAARFDSGVDDASGDLDGWTAIPAVLLGAGLLLVVAGVRPRLAEFA
ncbi:MULTISPECIES: hypothetical protein [Streptacidiphilus]|uniref:Secreted protein n=2 Tax=Streptacidiphilus TaxID=228398 RepID=A0ABV6UEA7_9ACTN|nr:hypothetical protein [Streptacidiphilus jeojiense]